MSKHFSIAQIIYPGEIPNIWLLILTYELSAAVFNLVEGVNVQEIEDKIQQYQKENAEQIMINQARKVFWL